MNTAVLAWINAAAAASLSASSEAADLGVNALATDHLAEVWRSADAGPQWVQADFGAPVEIGIIGLFGSNLTAGGLWRVRLGTTAGSGDLLDTGLVPAGVVPGYGQALHAPAAPVNARHLRVDLDDAGLAGAGYHQAGALWTGPLFRPARNFSYGAAIGWVDSSLRARTRGGQVITDKRPAWRGDSFALEFLSEAEKYELLELDRIAGLGGTVLWIREPGGAYQNRDAIRGTLADLTPIAHAERPIHSKSFRIEERL